MRRNRPELNQNRAARMWHSPATCAAKSGSVGATWVLPSRLLTKVIQSRNIEQHNAAALAWTTGQHHQLRPAPVRGVGELRCARRPAGPLDAAALHLLLPKLYSLAKAAGRCRLPPKNCLKCCRTRARGQRLQGWHRTEAAAFACCPSIRIMRTKRQTRACNFKLAPPAQRAAACTWRAVLPVCAEIASVPCIVVSRVSYSFDESRRTDRFLCLCWIGMFFKQSIHTTSSR